MDFLNRINTFVRDKTGIDAGRFLEEKKQQLQETYNSVDKNQFGGALPYGTPPSVEGIAERIEPLASSVVNSLVPGAAAVSMGYKLGAPVRQAVGAGFVDDFVDNGIDSIKEISSNTPLRFAGESFKAGVNPLAVLRGDQAAVQKLSDYYGGENNRGELNALPLDSQLFMRYLSGDGSQGLTIDKGRGKAIYQSILDQKNNITSQDAQEKIRTVLGDSHYNRVKQGDVPVYFEGREVGQSGEDLIHTGSPYDIKTNEPYRDELKNSLGSFWATPNDDGSYDIKEKYNFQYAPKDKGGTQRGQEFIERKGLNFFNVSDIGRQFVINGMGNPYEYKLRVSPDGTVLVNPD